jgi:hypothetical protein
VKARLTDEARVRNMDVLLRTSGSVLRARAPGGRFRKGGAAVHVCAHEGLPVGSQRAVRRVKKVSNALIFEAQISRNSAQRRLIDELLSIFAGRTQPVMAHLSDAGS